MRLGCCCKAPCHFFQTCWSSRLYFVWECHLWMNATWPGGSEETVEGCHSCHWRQWWGVIFRTDPQKISHELREISGEKYLRIIFLWERVLGFSFSWLAPQETGIIGNMNQCHWEVDRREPLSPVSILLGLINPIEHNDNGAQVSLNPNFC